MRKIHRRRSNHDDSSQCIYPAKITITDSYSLHPSYEALIISVNKITRRKLYAFLCQRTKYDSSSAEESHQGGVTFLLCLLLFASCTQRPLLIPVIIPESPYEEIHEHDYVASYELIGSSLIKTLVCSICGDETQETVSTGIQSISDKDAAEAVSPGIPATVAVNPETAQTVLDRIGSGSTVILSPGTYSDTLYLRPTRYNGTRIFKNEGGTGWGDGIEDFAGHEITDKETIPETGSLVYVYDLEGVRIIGTEGAVLSKEIKVSNGIGPNNGYDPVREKDLTGQPYRIHLDIDNLSIENINFSGSGKGIDIAFGTGSWKTDHINDLIITNCVFKGDGSGSGNTPAIHLEASESGYYSDLAVTDCDFSGYSVPSSSTIYIKNVSGARVENCKITGAAHNAIAIQTSGSAHFSGDIIIRNNEISSSGSSAIKFGNGAGTDNSIEITDNKITDSADEDLMIIDSGILSGYDVVISGNTYNGNKIPDRSGTVNGGNLQVTIE